MKRFRYMELPNTAYGCRLEGGVEPALLVALAENGIVIEPWARATIASQIARFRLSRFPLFYAPFLLLLKPSRNTPESLYLVVRLFFDIRHQFPNNQAQ